MADSFVKLDSRILDSSIWRESVQTRIVWITMLAMANDDGYVSAAIVGIADRARVTVEEAKAALIDLEAEDPESTTKTLSGKRIYTFCDGWKIVNYEKYKKKTYGDKRKAQNREAQARWRLKHPNKDLPIDFDPDNPPEENNPDQLPESGE